MSRRGENIRKRNDNRWEGRYIKNYDSDGKAKYGSVYGKTYFEVKRKLNEAKEQLLQNVLPTKDHEMTFREVLFLWLQNNQLKLKEQTYAKYIYLIEAHLVPSIGNIRMRKMSISVVNRFLSEKSEKGRLDGTGGLSPSYIQTLSFIIGSALEYAEMNHFCSQLSGEIVRPGKKTKNELEVLSAKEQAVLERFMMQDTDERKLGVLLSLYAGLRIGEVCGLKWEDIDFSSQVIHVRHTVERIPNVNAQAGESKTKLILGDAKTISSNRVIPISPNILPLLKECKHSGTFLLSGSAYEYTDPRTFQYCFHKYLDTCHLRSVNYHALRHTFATRCMEAGVDIKSLSEILGHASVNITLNIYVHSSLEQKRLQMDRLCAVCGQYQGQTIQQTRMVAASL